MNRASLYVVMNDGVIVAKSGSSNRGPAIYVLKRNAEKELEYQQTAPWLGKKLLADAEVVEFVPKASA